MVCELIKILLASVNLEGNPFLKKLECMFCFLFRSISISSSSKQNVTGDNSYFVCINVPP